MAASMFATKRMKLKRVYYFISDVSFMSLVWKRTIKAIDA